MNIVRSGGIQKATITIVDNIIRVMSLLIEEIKKAKIDGGQSAEKSG